ncbi:hypothetical protein FQR65_LT20284 [Abscondita terminalis]|nr:hypothetical protein FQR65_LT20284 [Abscondita terminalis]
MRPCASAAPDPQAARDRQPERAEQRILRDAQPAGGQMGVIDLADAAHELAHAVVGAALGHGEKLQSFPRHHPGRLHTRNGDIPWTHAPPRLRTTPSHRPCRPGWTRNRPCRPGWTQAPAPAWRGPTRSRGAAGWR